MDITGLIGFGAFTPAVAASGPITSIQYVSITMGSADTSQTATITSVDTSLTSIHYLGANSSTNQNDVALHRVELTNATTVTAYHNTADGSNAGTVKAVVVTWNSDWIQSIQHGTITVSSGNTNASATVSAVTVANSVAVWLGATSGGTAVAMSEGGCRIKINTTTAVRADRGSGTNNATVGFCLIEFKSAKLTSLQLTTTTITASSSSANTTISAVDDTNAIMFFGGQSSNTTSVSNATADAYRNSTTNVVSVRNGTAGTTTTNATIVEFASGTVNQSSRTETSFTGTSTTWGLQGLTVNTAKTLLMLNGWRTSTATTYPTALPMATLTNSTTATISKYTGTNTTVYSPECCEFV
jgi:hypothetical protein